jgi:NADH-quinone oxidoreductase subunit M
MLWMVQRVFFGPIDRPENGGLKDLDLREGLTACAFMVVVLVMGLWPQPLLDRIAPATDRFVARAQLGTPDSARVRDTDVRVTVPPIEGAPSPIPRAPITAMAVPRLTP